MWTDVLRASAVSALLTLLLVGPAAAQERQVRGTVTDGATGEPLPGANVTVQDAEAGTTTDANGRYQFEVPGPDAVLVFSFVGYQTERIEVGEQETINVTLQEEVGALEEVVVTGYGTQQRQEVSGSVSSVDAADANVGQIESPQDLLQGRVPGLSIAGNDGEPGSDQRVRVRGLKSLSANSQPLYVIDGSPVSSTNITPGGPQGSSNSANPLSLVNPRNIESIQVLKDAAATSIYGSQGSNGVVLIQTKEGSEGVLRANYSGQASIGRPSRKLNLLSADEFREARREFTEADIPPEEQETNTDWQDEVTRNAVSQEHNLSFSGGSEQTTYRASANYTIREGLVRESGFERLSGRLSVRHAVLDGRLRLNGKLFNSYLQRDHVFSSETVGASGDVLKDMLAFPPTKPVRSEDGTFFEFAEQNLNPVALQEQIVDDSDQRRTIGNLSIEYDLLEHLTARGAINLDQSRGIRKSFVPQASLAGQDIGGSGSQSQREFADLVVQSQFNYDRDDLFGGWGSLGIRTGIEYERETFQTVGLETQDFVTDAVPAFNNLGGGTNVQTPFSGKERVDQLGLFGRVNYDFENKYLLTVTARRDGSSVFGSKNRWAWFPSASVGWNIAQESFLDVKWLTQLKLRASGGVSGNQAVPPFESLPVLAPSRGNSAVFGQDTEIIGTTQQRTARPDLKWETTTEFNLGVDFTTSRLNGSVEYYTSTTGDLLLNVRVVQPAPSNFVLDNVGKVSNSGIEGSLEALVLDRADVSLTLTATASSNRNEVESLGGRGTIDHGTIGGRGLSGQQSQRLEPGHPIGSFYGPVFLRVNEQGQEVFRDGEGGTTTDAGLAEEVHLGNPVPDITYSLNADFRYQNLDVSVFLRGEQGRELLNNTALALTSKSRLAQGINILEEAVNDGTDVSHTPNISSRWVEDASFLRLDKLSIGYDLSGILNRTALSQQQLRRARLFVAGDNLLVITPYDGYDPELNTNESGEGLGFRNLATPSRGLDWANYPRPRTFTVGLQLGL